MIRGDIGDGEWRGAGEARLLSARHPKEQLGMWDGKRGGCGGFRRRGMVRGAAPGASGAGWAAGGLQSRMRFLCGRAVVPKIEKLQA